jgi:tryptophanyl-tRNA synthetase
MENLTYVTGIKSTGELHLGNYIGAIKPALKMAKEKGSQYYFIADYHSLNAVHDASELRKSRYQIAAAWIALGLNPDEVIFYNQSDVPEILELQWILSCVTPKGLLNRAHAYKALVSENNQNGIDIDTGVNMGLFNYPILMAADILIFQANKVPVGKDQVQHIEIARDIADYFNRIYGDTFCLPDYVVEEEGTLLPGLDGRKMSKSYGNTIPLFCEESELRKKINRIKTDSSLPNEPKDPNESVLYQLYREFSTTQEREGMKRLFRDGVGWGEVKKLLFEVINRELSESRNRYYELMDNPEYLNRLLSEGAVKARAVASPMLKDIKKKVGF